MLTYKRSQQMKLLSTGFIPVNWNGAGRSYSRACGSWKKLPGWRKWKLLDEKPATAEGSLIRMSSSQNVRRGREEPESRLLSKIHLPMPKGKYGVSMVDVMSYGVAAEGQLVRLMLPCDRKDVWSVQDSWKEWLPADKYVEGFSTYVNLWPSVLRVIMWLTTGTQYLPLFTQEPCATSGDDGNEENAKRKFPVVVFSHGLGQCRSSYSVLCSHLASHGFVVAAIEHRDGSACITPEAVEAEVTPFLLTSSPLPPRQGSDDDDDAAADNNSNPVDDNDNNNDDLSLWTNPGLRWMPYTRVGPQLTEQTLRTSQLRQRADEVSRCVEFLRRLNDGVLKRDSFYAPRPGDSAKWGVLRSLAGRLDMSRLLLSGHSMGGVTTMKVLSKENDLFRCGIALDPWMYALRTEADDLFPKIGKSPLLCITMEAFQNLPNQKCLGKLLALAPEDAHREIITIKGSVHESQADAPFMSNQSAISRIVSRYLIGPPSVTDHELIMDINVALMLKFASQFLEMEKFEDAEAELKENEDLLRKGLIMDVDHEKPRIIHKL